MKKKNHTNLSPTAASVAERASEYRFLAESSCHEYNEQAEHDAIEEFEKGETAVFFRDNAKFATGLVLIRRDAVASGKLVPIPLSEEKMFLRLLTALTEADYDAEGYDEGLTDEETVEAWENSDLVHEGYMSSATTPTTELQCALHHALVEYARTAAICAKRIKSASLMDWASMIDILENHPGHRLIPLSEEEATRLLALERSAADQLRLDQIVHALPTRKPSKKRRKAR